MKNIKSMVQDGRVYYSNQPCDYTIWLVMISKYPPRLKRRWKFGYNGWNLNKVVPVLLEKDISGVFEQWGRHWKYMNVAIYTF